MKTYHNPGRELWAEITARPEVDTAALQATVAEVIAAVRERGDAAVREYGLKFDKADLDSLEVSPGEMEAAMKAIPADLAAAIRAAHANIAAFHKAQTFAGVEVETAPGVECWQRSVPIGSVGLYVPGGTAPLFSTVLMLATPAKIAGCREIVVCTPPGKDGSVNPAILAAAAIAGVDRIYKVGGVQAVAAMAYGTETIPKVSKIFGPGNSYVMAAKQAVGAAAVAVDMPAGPSEVCVIADGKADPAFVAADLLSQAEHGPDSQVLLVSTSAELVSRVEAEIGRQMATLPRREVAERAMANSVAVVLGSTAEAMELSNAYAPEHLIIATEDCDSLAGGVVNAGSVFIGKWACESAGDYASGTNHTLPTHGYATAYSGVNLDSFCRKITFQKLSERGVASIGRTVETMARHEMLDAHANAMAVRIERAGA